MTDFSRFLLRAETLIDRLEAILPPALPVTDWSACAFRWRTRNGRGWLEGVRHPHTIRLADLQGVEAQKKRIEQNTRQFVQGKSANNVLLTGARGTGKSSLVKALLNQFSHRKLRLIEVDKDDLVYLPDIVDLVFERREKFIIFCDDLSFEANEPGYKAMKSLLDGSITGMPENLLVYATSNRRHLMPEFMHENTAASYDERGEIRPGESTEEKVSLSDRFGLTLTFWPFSQDDYLAIVAGWVAALGGRVGGDMQQEALQWSIQRGGRSGRVAQQFARDWVGRQGLRRKR